MLKIAYGRWSLESLACHSMNLKCIKIREHPATVWTLPIIFIHRWSRDLLFPSRTPHVPLSPGFCRLFGSTGEKRHSRKSSAPFSGRSLLMGWVVCGMIRNTGMAALHFLESSVA